MSAPASPKPIIKREEWDFSLLPENEYDACLRYELAREVKDYISFFEISKDAANNRASHLEDNPNEIFPEEDYLYLGVMFPGYAQRPVEQLPAHYPAVSWQEIPVAVRKNIVQIAESRSLGVQSYMSGPLHTARDIRSQEAKGKGVHSLLIDWRQSDASLLGDFRYWLEENRPSKIPVIVHRGRQQLSDDLNAIGAMRLRHHYIHADAAKITEAILGKPLYSDSFAWERAAHRARNLFFALFLRAGEPKSGTSIANPRGRPRKKTA